MTMDTNNVRPAWIENTLPTGVTVEEWYAYRPFVDIDETHLIARVDVDADLPSVVQDELERVEDAGFICWSEPSSEEIGPRLADGRFFSD